jgi:cobalt-zinc-cadmium efflux system protein
MSRAVRLRIVLALNLALVTALVMVGIAAHSLGVFAEGADYIGDAAAIGVTLFALRLAARPPSPRRPHGHPKASAWAALVNAAWLLLLTLLVAASAIDRLATGVHPVHGLAVLIVSAIAAIVMLVGAGVLGGEIDPLDNDDPDDLAMRAVLLDTAADAAAAGTVAVAGAVIAITDGSYWLDPAVALLVSGVVGYHALLLVRKVTRTLR